MPLLGARHCRPGMRGGCARLPVGAPLHGAAWRDLRRARVRWVGVISVAGLIAAVIVAALCVHVGEIDDAPGLVLIGGGVAIGGAAFALVVVVMRGLSRSATMLRRELDEVV